MSDALPAIVLASASPRRRELLRAAGLQFELGPVDVDEDLGAFDEPDRAARELALLKARTAVQSHRGEPRWVIGSDTIVCAPVDGAERLLGKPVDADEAHRMLGWLSGTRHAVVTGVAVIRCQDGAEFVEHERTWVHMRSITADEQAAYVASGEWLDKAGGYAIQENADVFVTRLEGGGFDNVVGLPVARTLALLAQAGAPLGAARAPRPE